METINEGNRGSDLGYLGLNFRINENKWESLLINFFDKEDLNEEHGIEEEPHITVLYGFLPSITLNNIKPLMVDKVIYIDDIRISGLSLFENDKYDVVKLDIESDKLHTYNTFFKDTLENECTFPEYQPHITLAYVKKGTGKKYINQFTERDLIKPLMIMLRNADVYYNFSDSEKNYTTFSIICN